MRIDIDGALGLTHSYFTVTRSPDKFDTILTLTEGDPIDVAVKGPQARQSGFTGKGIRIGVISDSFDATGGMARDVMDGRLPSGVQVLADHFFGTDEGRAMAQIVHAIAPDASIAFYHHGDMRTAVRALAQDGCQVIVDDVFIYREVGDTILVDGPRSPLNLAINEAVRAGVTYVASAGNSRGSIPITGHHENPAILTVAAMNVLSTPVADGYLPTRTEGFSSLGETSDKPDITAPDGGPTSLPLFKPNGMSPFFGTSAAAPAAAAVAALMLQANPQLTSNPLLLDKLMMAAATPFGEPSSYGGAGLVNAAAAVAAAYGAQIFFYRASGQDGPGMLAALSPPPSGPMVEWAEVSKPEGVVKAGETVQFIVSLDGGVTVSGGTPGFVLNSGGVATFDLGRSSPADGRLVFDYTVGVQEHAANLAIAGFTANGATVHDGSGSSPDFSVLFQTPVGLTVSSPLIVVSIATDQTGEVPLGGSARITVTLNEGVTIDAVGGLPTLTLSNGAIATFDVADSDLAAGRLVFEYAIGNDGERASELALYRIDLPSGTTVRDTAGNNADFVGAFDRDLDLQIGPAFVRTVFAPSQSSVLHVGHSELISLSISAGVTLDTSAGLPTLVLANGGLATYDAAASDLAAGIMAFDYLPGIGEQTAGIVISHVDLHGAMARDGHGVAVDFTDVAQLGLGVSVGSPLVVESIQPSLTGMVAPGASLELAIRMSEGVLASGADVQLGLPTLTLSNGAIATYDVVSSAPGLGLLVFDYTVGVADGTGDLKINAVDVGGVRMTDIDSYNADFAGALGVSLGVSISATPVATHDDAFVVIQGKSLTAAASVLSNDDGATTATLLVGAGHGAVQLAADGNIGYTPAAGFAGIDSFTYHATNGSSAGDGRALVYVVPVQVGQATTLNLLALDAEEQIASTYVAFFGRAADAGGFGFWVGEFNRLLPVQGPAALFANIASSFGISAEAKALYPFLANPFGASDGQISAFLDSVYNNLFDRSSDAGGLAYWTGQIKQTLQAGQFVGSVLINIMSGAQDTAAGKDITALMGKVAVSLAYVHEQQEHATVWAGASDIAAATALLDPVAAEPQTVLTGIRNAEILIAGHA